MFKLFFTSVLAIIFWINAGATGSDSLRTPLVLGIRPHYGFVIIHSSDIWQIRNSHPRGLEINLSWHYISEKSYNTCLCFPRLGLSLTYWDFDNPEILGQGLTLTGFVEPFFGNCNRVSFSFRAGTGFAYANKPYDEETNPNNFSYSTKFGFALLLAATLNYKLSKRVNFNFSANYNHISNSGINEPNKGINYPTISLGLGYFLRTGEFVKFPKKDWKTKDIKRNKIHLSIFGNAKQTNEKGEFERYLVWGLSGMFARQVSRLSAIGLGLEFLNDGALKEEIKRNTSGSIDYKMIGILAGHEFLLGKFIFSQQIGFYIYDQYKANTFLYQRYGLVFKLSKRIFTGIDLKAHGHVANFIVFKLGFTFSCQHVKWLDGLMSSQ